MHTDHKTGNFSHQRHLDSLSEYQQCKSQNDCLNASLRESLDDSFSNLQKWQLNLDRKLSKVTQSEDHLSNDDIERELQIQFSKVAGSSDKEHITEEENKGDSDKEECCGFNIISKTEVKDSIQSDGTKKKNV